MDSNVHPAFFVFAQDLDLQRLSDYDKVVCCWLLDEYIAGVTRDTLIKTTVKTPNFQSLLRGYGSVVLLQPGTADRHTFARVERFKLPGDSLIEGDAKCLNQRRTTLIESLEQLRRVQEEQQVAIRRTAVAIMKSLLKA